MQYISKSYKILQNPYHRLTKFREGIDPMHISVSIEQNSKIPCKNECSLLVNPIKSIKPMTYINKTYYIKKTQTHSNEFRLTAQN